MAGLSVIFKAIDEISDKLDAMSSAGNKTLDAFDKLSDTADKTFANTTEETQKATEAMEKAAQATDYWTDAVGNYDKGCLEAVYSTEELVNMGFKTEDALKAEADAAEEAQDKTEQLGEEMEKTSKKSEDFGDKSKNAVVGLDDILATVGIVAALNKIADAFSNASDKAAEFETNVAMVSTVADTTVLSADQLSTQISGLSKDTAKNVNELADATYNAISAGVATEGAVETVGEASKLATAGFTSSASALSVLTTALNAYQLEASEVTNISDSLITSQNLGVMTIDQLSSSMGKAISTASAYSIDLYNLESGYISLTKAGVSVEESTTYLSSMFNELGSSSSDVSKILVEETGQSFGQLMESGYTLADVLEILYNNVDQNSEALMNLWGSAEAGKAANAVINQGLDTFNTNLDKLRNSAGTTEKAYATMTNTTEFATQRMENSFDNLAIAIGDDLNPTVSQFKNGIADITDEFTELITKHPAISALLTGAAVGIGGVTLAITAYTAVTKIATVVTAAMGTTMSVALGPLALVAAAIGGVTAAVIYFNNTEDEMAKAQENLTLSSKETEKELNNLKDQYAALEEAGEADTVAAYELKNQIDELSDSFEANKQTIADLITQTEELRNALDEVDSKYEETMSGIDDSESSSKSLIAQLVAMQENTSLSGDQMEIMQSIVDRLNNSYEGLNLTLDSTNGKLNMSVEDLWQAVTDSANQEKAQANMDKLMDYIGQYQNAQATFDEANRSMNAAYEEYQRALDEDWSEEHPFLAWSGLADGAEMNWSGSVKDAYNEWSVLKDATADAEAEFNRVTDTIRECYEEMGYSEEEIDSMMSELALASASATEASEVYEQQKEVLESTSDGYEEAGNIIQGYSAKIEELCTKYDEAYSAALQSVQGQYDLWTEVDDVAAMSSQSIKDALQSQIDYWNSYNENMASLTARADDIEGLSDMLAQLSDGSEESAAMLAGMESMNDADLSAVVQQYNNLQTAQSDTATSMAELETDFSDSLTQIQTDMETAVDNLNLSDEAKANAKSTMDAYVQEIQNGVAKAQKAIDSLSFANTTLKGGGYHAYAEGTVDAEPGLALVGEEGPELVNFGGGEVVYTADETANILAKDTSSDSFYVEPEQAVNDTAGGDRTVTFRVEGAGEMKVTGNGVTKEDVVSLLMSNMKDVLMGIIQQEIDEEGDWSYEF